MRKKLSALIVLAMTLSFSNTVFASEPVNTSTSVDNKSTINLKVDEAINGIEDNNLEIKLMKQKVDALNKQYDLDHNKGVDLPTEGAGVDRLQANLQQLIVPLRDEQNSKNQENAVNERLNALKFDIERQYMNILTCGDQIDNINKTIVNIDEKIKQLQEKIKVGQATADSLNPLNVQKKQLIAQISDIKAQIDKSYLTIKQSLNLDLNRNVTLTSTKKDYVKFDDSDIDKKINEAVQKDYSLTKIKKNIDITKQERDINFKYQRNTVAGEVSAEMSLADLETSLINTNTNLRTALWNAYYDLKSKEELVKTEFLNEKNAKEAYDKMKSNYDNGMVDKVALDSAALAFDKEKNLVQRSVNEYMVTQQEFKYMLQGHAAAPVSSQSMGVSSIEY